VVVVVAVAVAVVAVVVVAVAVVVVVVVGFVPVPFLSCPLLAFQLFPVSVQSPADWAGAMLALIVSVVLAYLVTTTTSLLK
jgi:hypothetical protein